jgi:hypothetical protein
VDRRKVFRVKRQFQPQEASIKVQKLDDKLFEIMAGSETTKSWDVGVGRPL